MNYPFEVPSEFVEPDKSFLDQYQKLPAPLKRNFQKLLDQFRDSNLTPGRRLEQIRPGVFSARLNRKYRFVYELLSVDGKSIGRPLAIGNHDETYDSANRR